MLLDHGCVREGLLHCAIACNQLKAAQLLLQSGVDANELRHNKTPLLVCLKNHALEFAKLLLENGADPYLPVDGQVALYHAVAAGDLDFVKFLCVQCHQIGAFEPCRPPLARAIEGRDFAIISYLLSQGADPNVTTEVAGETVTLLDLAIARRDQNTLSLLLKCGADAARANRKLMTKEIAECVNGYEDIDDPFDPDIEALGTEVEGVDKETSLCVTELLVPITGVDDMGLSHRINAVRKALRIVVGVTQKTKSISDDINDKRLALLQPVFAGSSPEEKSRVDLLTLNKKLQQLRKVILNLRKSFHDLWTNAWTFMENAIALLNKRMGVIDEIAHSQNVFLRMGFGSDIFGEMVEENIPKKNVIIETLSQLANERENLLKIFIFVYGIMESLAR